MKKITDSIIFLIIGLLAHGQIPTDIPLELRAQFNGRYGYTFVGNTLNEFDNYQTPPPPCQMLTESSATLNLLPNQSLVAAYLYWSGIGDGTHDPEVMINGEIIYADYTLVVDPYQSSFSNYFGNFKDITTRVNTFGNGLYTFSNLDLNPIIDPYCTNGIYRGGWSILVVYEDTSLPIQQVNIYDGLASVYGFEDNASTTINIGNLNVSDNTNATIGYLAWNGSPNLFFNESISFNGSVLSNAINPVDNPFNGTNSYTGSTDLWNMDLDVFDISSLIEVGDTEATLTFTSAFDRIIQNVVTVIPSELPDATLSNVAISNQDACDDRDITIDLNLNNLNSFEVLPANTPWSIFALDSDGNEVFIASFFTQTTLPIDGSESQTVNISIPPSIPNSTTLILRANTLQDGTNPTNESNVLNNEVTVPLVLPQTPSITNAAEDISLCGSLEDNTVIDLTQNNLASLGVQNPEEYTMSYHLSDIEAQNGSNPIANPNDFVATSNPQTIFVRVESVLSPTCFATTSFEVSYQAVPQIQQTLDINECQIGSDLVLFDLSLNNATSMGIADPAASTISYHNTLADAQSGDNVISNTAAYNADTTNATIYVRAQNSTNPSCFSTASFQLNTFTVNIGNLQNLSSEACTSLGLDAVYDLTINAPLAIGNQDPSTVSLSYHLTEAEAQNGNNAIANPTAYNSNALNETIWLRLTLDTAPTSCAAVDSFTLTTEPLTVVNNVSDLSIQACVFPNEPVSFDLTENSAIALGDQNPQVFNISYHNSEADAQNGNNAIADPSNYENTSNPQTLWLRMERNDILPLCYAIAPFDIEVVGTPEVNFNPTPLQICASDGNGFALFDLSQSIADITFGNPDIAVSFHSSMVDAQSNTEVLPLSFTNTIAVLQTIYFRTEDTVNSCSFTSSLELQALEVPQLSNEAAELSGCAIDSTKGVFNLTDIEPLLIENATNADFDVQYFLSEADAINNANPIANPSNFFNTSNPQTLWLGVANSNNCYAIASFELNVLTSTVIEDNVIIDNLSICSEDPTALLATIDLRLYDTLINPDAATSTEVRYYQGWANFNLDASIENPESFVADVSNTTIVAQIVNTETLCSSPVPISFEITINPLPVFSLPERLPLCVDAQTDELLDVWFSPPILDTNLPASSSLDFQWFFNGEPLTQTMPNLTATSAGSYMITVTDINTNCSYSQNVLVEAVNPPVFSVAILSPAFSSMPSVEVQNISGQGEFEFQLDNGLWQSLEQGATSLLFSTIADGMHTISGRDLSGCGTSTVEFTILGFSPFFTPNGDGTNDFWNITSLSDQPNARITIFDRFGKVIYTGKPQQGGWDGTYNGKLMPTDDYWFKVEFTDPINNKLALFKSHFTLKR